MYSSRVPDGLKTPIPDLNIMSITGMQMLSVHWRYLKQHALHHWLCRPYQMS